MKNLKKLGTYLAITSTVISGCLSFIAFMNLNIGEALAWLTAASWSSTAFILEISLYRNGNSNT